jgi:hypothetical protein
MPDPESAATEGALDDLPAAGSSHRHQGAESLARQPGM